MAWQARVKFFVSLIPLETRLVYNWPAEVADKSEENGKQPSMARRLKRKRLVFVSHSARDTWVARQIAREISACGAEPFLDEAEIEVGEDFEEEILTFLNKADELVVLMTPWALERPYVLAELGAAWTRQIPIVILLHGMTTGDFQSRPEIPLFLKKRNLIDLNAIDKYFVQLRKRVRS